MGLTGPSEFYRNAEKTLSADETPGKSDFPDAVSPPPMPRGVATPDGRRAFFAGLDNTVQAIDVETGKRTWSVEIDGQPIAAANGQVVIMREASPGVLTMLVLDETDGHEVGRCNVTLPPGIDVSAASGQFGLRPSILDDRLLVEWEAQSSYAGGAPPPTFVEDEAARRTTGTFECDLTAGHVRTAQSGAAEAPAPRTSWPYRLGGDWHKSAWRVGESLATLELDRSGPQAALLLRTFAEDDESTARSSVIAESDAVEPTVTPDGRHVFVRLTVPPGEPWHIWDAIDHTEVGIIDYQPGSEFPAVLDERAYYVAPTTSPTGTGYDMRAVDLVTGKVVWDLQLGAPAPRKITPPPPRMR